MSARKCEILIFFLLLHCESIWLVVGISPQIQTNVFKGVPDNWATSIDIDPFVKIGQKYYYIETTQQTSWYMAAHECRRRNANLASIESAEEHEALSQYLMSKNYKQSFWTSANDLIKEGSYYWLGTGNPIAYIQWAYNQPDNPKGNSNALTFVRDGEKFLMNDWDCTAETNYICEAKTPTTIALTLW